MPRGTWTRLACLALLALVRLAFVAERTSGDAATFARDARAQVCRDEGCGCPHEHVDAACCCAPQPVAARAPQRVLERPARRASAPLFARVPEVRVVFPSAVLTGFHCRGSGRSLATADAEPPSLALSTSGSVSIVEARGFPRKQR